MTTTVVTTIQQTGLAMSVGDILYIAQSGSIISATGYAVSARNATSTGLTIAIDGSAVGIGDSALILDSVTTAATQNHSVRIGETGLVRSMAAHGIEIAGNLSSVENSGSIYSRLDGIRHTEGSSFDMVNNGLISAGQNGISIFGDDCTVVNTGRIVAEGSGISIVGINAKVSNTGSVLGQTGISVSGPNARIGNSGRIDGSEIAVEIQDGARLTNSGDLLSTYGYGVQVTVTDAAETNVVTNTGTITGLVGGVWFFMLGSFGDGAGQKLFNSGAITTDYVAVSSNGPAMRIINEGSLVSGGAAAVTSAGQVTLVNYGLVSGGVAANGTTTAVSLTAGADVIRNFGTITGTVSTGEGNDVVRNGGSIDREVILGAGSDQYFGRHSTEDATIYGGDQRDVILSGGGDDLIFGGSGNDVIAGGDGNDTIWAEFGTDNLTGNAGADLFVFGSAIHFSSDEITDFRSGEDRINLGAFMPGGSFISAAAFSGAQQVRYTAATGRVEGDVNGDGTADWTLILLNAPATLAASDFVFT